MEERIKQAKKPQGDEGTKTLERMNQSHEELTLWALSLLQGEYDEILDVGCGGGATLSRLLRKYPQSQVHGIDYSPEGVALSKAHNEKDLDQRCFVREASVLALPFEEDRFSLITAFETIYFWGDYPKALGEIRRVLKPEGVFLVCCEMSEKDNPKWAEALPLMEIRRGEEWKTLLNTHGFSQVACHTGTGEWITLVAKV